MARETFLHLVASESPPRRFERPGEAILIAVEGKLAPGAWERRAKVTDVAARAQRWEELRAMPGEGVRVLDGEAILHRSYASVDEEILAYCPAWIRTVRVVGDLMVRTAGIDPVLIWRVRELLSAGTLEGRGAENMLGLPDEVRRTARN